jgi:hypothetical protein
MNPRTIRWQACVTVPLLLMVALIATPVAAYCLAGVALVLTGALNGGYAYSLGRKGRPQRRRHGDRWVARYVAFGFGGPLVIGVALDLAGYDQSVHVWDFTVAETSTMVIAGGTLFVLIMLSSLIDWYYIRPRIDGVVCAPPCRSSGSDTWKGPTRWWFLHRGIATLAYIGFALVIALVIMLMLVRVHKTAAGVIGGVGGIAGLLLIFAGRYRSELPTVAQFVLSPAYCLGDDLAFHARRGPERGYVLHVAVPVTKLVPLDDEGHPTDVPFVERKNTDLAEADPVALRTVACDGRCAKLNPQCAADLPRQDHKRRYLIL